MSAADVRLLLEQISPGRPIELELEDGRLVLCAFSRLEGAGRDRVVVVELGLAEERFALEEIREASLYSLAEPAGVDSLAE